MKRNRIRESYYEMETASTFKLGVGMILAMLVSFPLLPFFFLGLMFPRQMKIWDWFHKGRWWAYPFAIAGRAVLDWSKH